MVTENLSPDGLVKLMIKENPAIKPAIALHQIYASSAKMAELLANYWETATPEEKQSLTSQVQSVFRRST